MEQENGNKLCLSIDDLCVNGEDGNKRGKSSKRKHYNEDGERVFISKNLEAERKRRVKLNSRLCTLRTLVPILTDLTMYSIIEDAITYTRKLQDEVVSLTQGLQAMEAEKISEERAEPKIDEFSASEQMNSWGIQEEVQVEKIDGNTLWMKMIIEKKRGRFKKLMETINDLGIEMIEANVTTIKGAYVITTCIRGKGGEALDVYHAKRLFPHIIKSV